MKEISPKLIALVGGILFILTLVSTIGVYIYLNQDDVEQRDPLNRSSRISSNRGEILQFESEEAFVAYLQTNTYSGGRGWGGGVDVAMPTLSFDEQASSNDGAGGRGQPAPERYSETNQQVLLVDEADIVKTDGELIFYSKLLQPQYPTPLSVGETGEMMYWGPTPRNTPYLGSVKVLDAFPPADMSILSEINYELMEDSYYYSNSELFLQEDVLVILNDSGSVVAYDVSTPASPEKVWSMEIEDGISIISKRVFEGEIYLVTQQYIGLSVPGCIIPLADTLTIRCTDIYYPDNHSETNSLSSVIKLNYETGGVIDEISFLADYGTTVYMSGEAIYIAYTLPAEDYLVVSGFISEYPELFPDLILAKIDRLKSYDLSNQTKTFEIDQIMEKYQLGLSKDEQLQLRNGLTNSFNEYLKQGPDGMLQTGIIKIESDNLEIGATGAVTGRLLNQFSMDEKDDYLRMATTVSGRIYRSWLEGGIEDQNDLLILDKNLSLVSTVRGMGIDERIYSARFVGEMAYVVTFRETDPFYVLDLSDPLKPELKGELKIPGYSSYLHPISDTLIMGVGMEGRRVKVSLFDVSDPTDPTEASQYLLSDYWSEVGDNHHAFLHDAENQVVFIPGSEGGYIISYEGEKLSLKKSISEEGVRRAIYIDDYMYIFSDNWVTVVDMNSWESVKRLNLN